MVLPYPPSANRYWRHNRGRTHRSEEAVRYIQGVHDLCEARGVVPLDGELVIHADFYRPRRTGDLDNMLKVLLDALRKHAYNDDKQIVELHTYRYDDKANPRVAIWVERKHDEEGQSD